MAELIEIKEGTKTRYVTKKAWERIQEESKQRRVTAGDITCSGAKSVAMFFTDEQYDSIFMKGKKK